MKEVQKVKLKDVDFKNLNMDIIKGLFLEYKEIILYVIFGGFTTLINVGSFFIMTHFFNWDENLSNFIAIVLAVLFAYITNKDMVFHSKAKSVKEKITGVL